MSPIVYDICLTYTRVHIFIHSMDPRPYLHIRFFAALQVLKKIQKITDAPIRPDISKITMLKIYIHTCQDLTNCIFHFRPAGSEKDPRNHRCARVPHQRQRSECRRNLHYSSNVGHSRKWFNRATCTQPGGATGIVSQAQLEAVQ